MNDFEEYIQAGEPGRRERAEAWATAIGLQQVDGLVPSQFLFNTAIEHIEGRISRKRVWLGRLAFPGKQSKSI